MKRLVGLSVVCILLLSADLAGSQTRTLAVKWHNLEPAWSPDGQRIAFSSNRDGNYELYVMNADGSGQRRLTHNRPVDAGPSWSPDGKRLAFARDPWSEDLTYLDDDVWVIDVDGTNDRR